MPTEIIFALVLSSLFLGALAWLCIYSHIQHRKAGRTESNPSPAEPKAEEVRAAEVRTPRASVLSQAAKR